MTEETLAATSMAAITAEVRSAGVEEARSCHAKQPWANQQRNHNLRAEAAAAEEEGGDGRSDD